MYLVLRSWICAASVFMTQYYFPLSQDSCWIDPIYSKLPLHFYIRDSFGKTTVLFVVWAGQRIKPFGIIFCFLWTTNSTVFLDKAVLLLFYWRDSILISCGGVCGFWCNLLPNEIFIFSRPCIFLCLIISLLFLPHLRCDRYSRAIAVLGFLSDSFKFQLNFVGVFSSARPSLVYSPCVRLLPSVFPWVWGKRHRAQLAENYHRQTWNNIICGTTIPKIWTVKQIRILAIKEKFYFEARVV